MEVSVSILNSVDRLSDVYRLNDCSCDYVHIDVMDGKFVREKQFTMDEVNTLVRSCDKKVDVHLMCEDPNFYIDGLSEGVSLVTIHSEIDVDKWNLIRKIKEKNINVGMAIKPNTDVYEIVPYLYDLSLVLVMSVEPGYGGQEFMESSLDKVRVLRKIIEDKKLDIKIEIDGGVKDTNIKRIEESGVDIAVVGSFVTKSVDYEDSILRIKGKK